MTTKQYIEYGHIVKYSNIVHVGVFDGGLEPETELLKAVYAIYAAVIAGIVLKTTLRKFFSYKNIQHSNINKMNFDLTKVRVYNKTTQKEITYLADIRNSAAHGDNGQFKDADVSKMISSVNSLVSDMLS